MRIFTISDEYDDNFQIMFHEILNEMILHEEIISNFISIHLQDVVKIFPNVLTRESFSSRDTKLYILEQSCSSRKYFSQSFPEFS